MATASSVVAYYKKEKKKVTREELKPVGRGCRGVAGPEQKQQLHKCVYLFQRSNTSLCKKFPEAFTPVFSSRLCYLWQLCHNLPAEHNQEASSPPEGSAASLLLTVTKQ